MRLAITKAGRPIPEPIGACTITVVPDEYDQIVGSMSPESAIPILLEYIRARDESIHDLEIVLGKLAIERYEAKIPRRPAFQCINWLP